MWVQIVLLSFQRDTGRFVQACLSQQHKDRFKRYLVNYARVMAVETFSRTIFEQCGNEIRSYLFGKRKQQRHRIIAHYDIAISVVGRRCEGEVDPHLPKSLVFLLNTMT